MQCEERKRFPSCGHYLVESEKIQYSGKNDCRSDPYVFCTTCGWKKYCTENGELFFNYHL